MDNHPTLTWSIEFRPGTGNKLSYIEPYNTCTVTFSADKAFKKFVCRSTYEDEDWGKDTGILVQEFNNRDAGVELSFTINSLRHLLHDGEQQGGMYRIGMYAQDSSGEWNVVAVFYVGTSEEFYVVTSGGTEAFNTTVIDTSST